jgi:hypothetical protein
MYSLLGIQNELMEPPVALNHLQFLQVIGNCFRSQPVWYRLPSAMPSRRRFNPVQAGIALQLGLQATANVSVQRGLGNSGSHRSVGLPRRTHRPCRRAWRAGLW